MRALFLILVLAIGAQARLFAEEQPTKEPPPHELLEQARLAAKQAQQSHETHKYTEAVDLYSRFISHYPTHDQAPSALNRLGTLYRATYKNREALIRALRKLIEQDEQSKAYKAAMNWINGNEALLEWKFGTVPSIVRATKDQGIKVALGNVFWRRAYLPTYRLYRVQPDAIESRIEESDFAYAGTRLVNPRDVPRDSWETVSFRTEMFKPNPQDPRATLYAQSGRQTELFDTLYADLSAGGLFVLEQELEEFRQQTVFHVPKFGLFCKAIGNETFVFAANAWTGQPIKDLKVDLRLDNKLHISRRTNDQGFASLPNGDVPSGTHPSITARLGNDVQARSLYLSTSSKRNAIAFITTDRPIYRPNQTVQFKAVLRNRVKGALKLTERKNLRVEIRGPEGRLLQSQEYPVNEFGSLSGSFQLTDEPALGEYGIVVHVPRPLGEDEAEWLDNDWEKYWSQTFEVAEYRKPEFEVTVSPQGGSTLLGDKMQATINARYYFGGAVNAADVQWKVVSSESTKGIDTQQFQPFEDPRAWFYESQPVFGNGSIGTSFEYWDWWGMPDELVASGEGESDEQGNLEITFDSHPGETPVKYTITATVRDATRMTAIGSADMEAHPTPYEITVGTTRLFYEPGEEIDARVRIKTRDGEPVANQQLKLSAFMQLGDGSVSEAEFESFLTEQLRTDDQGLATAKFVAKESGRLRLRVEVNTPQDGKAVARCDLWIAGDAAVAQDQFNFGIWGGFGTGLGGGGFGFGTSNAQEDDSLYLAVDSDLLAYSPGETMRLMVRSSQAPLTALLLIEGDEVHSTKVIRLSKQCEVLEIPVTRDMPSRARVSLLAWSGGEFDWGNTEIVVYPAENLLNVAVEAEQSNYAPREKAHVSLNVTDANGKPVVAEVELGIVDQSLFDLAEDNSFDIRSFFFPSPALQGISSYANVTVPHEDRYAEDRFADLAFGGSGFAGGGFGGGGFGGGFGGGLGGGGGGFFGGSAQRPFVTSVIPIIGGGGEVGGPGGAMPAATEIRSKFADTFYWSANVQVGEDGKAELDLGVPDTLGQWRIVARAISSADRFGIATSSVVSRKDVIVRLSAPRFFTQGDQATVSTIVNNNLEKEATFLVKLECEGAVAGGQQTRTIAAGGQARIDWPIKLAQSGTVTLRTKALSETASDAMELKLPVRPYGIEKRIVRNGRLEKGAWNKILVVPEDADLDSAKLEIVVSSASNAAIRDALPYLADYPYGCVEQTMSRFLPAVVASGAMKRQGIENKGLAEALPHMVEQGLQRLYSFQHVDGGWGWWKHDDTDDFMTTYVVFGLLTAQQAGYEVSEQILQEGVEAVQDSGLTPFSAYVLRMAKADIEFDLNDIGGLKDPAPAPLREGGTDPFGDGPNPFDDTSRLFRRGEFFVALRANKHRFATEDLAYLVLAGFKDLADQLPPDPPKHSDPNLVRTTALVVRALVSVDPKDKRIPPLVDWLMQQRRGGAWYSTLDTAYAVFALSALAEPGDNPPVQVAVNGMRTESMSGRVVLTGKDIRRGENKIEIHQPDGKRIAYASVLINYFATDLDKPAEKDARLAVRRNFERAVIVDGKKQWRAIESGGKVTIDDELRVTTIVNRNDQVERVMIESPLPAGTEPRVDHIDDDVYWDFWFGRRELRDDRVSIAANHLYGDDNQFEFRLRPTLPGRYHVLPARVFPMYNPDQQAHSSPFVIEVVDSKWPCTDIERKAQ